MSKIFLITLRAADDATAIHALRALLKILLRRYGFKCLDAHEIPDRASPDDPATTGRP
jgi:hypothetical protein